MVYGFDGMGRGDGQAQFILDFNSQSTAARLALGGFTQNFRGNSTKLMPDQSYLAEKFGPVLLYGGYLSHWWGPGWISALSLSNNARPMPQIGLERLDTSASNLAGAALAWALAVGIPGRSAGRAAHPAKHVLQWAAVHL